MLDLRELEQEKVLEETRRIARTNGWPQPQFVTWKSFFVVYLVDAWDYRKEFLFRYPVNAWSQEEEDDPIVPLIVIFEEPVRDRFPKKFSVAYAVQKPRRYGDFLSLKAAQAFAQGLAEKSGGIVVNTLDEAQIRDLLFLPKEVKYDKQS